MIAWFAKNSVAANLLMVTIALAGLLSLYTELTLEVFPHAELDTVRVSVPLRGATPEDIELGVATRIEEAVQDLEGIEKITSTSREGATTVVMEIDSDYDTRDLLDDIKGRVDAINTFPADAEKPVISLAEIQPAVIDVVISGDYSSGEIQEFAEKTRDDLLRIKGITQVELSYVRNYEIAIEASQHRLRAFNLTLDDLARAIRNSSLDISSGNLRSSGGDILIRSQGQAYRQTEFADIVVKTNSDGSIIRISDVATVNDSFEEESLETSFNGKNAAFVKVRRVGEQSALEVASLVKNYIQEQQNKLPVGMFLSYWEDDSEVLKKRLNILQSTAIQGAVLVILLLTLFLRPAIALWVFIGIPITFLGAIFVMSTFGVTLNVLSAFGFIIVLGIVVDDAIVTGENVYTHLRSSSTGLEAAINGTKEVAVPVTFGVLTTIAAFAPLAMIEGRLGQVISVIPAVVIPVLIFSLIESKFVLPAHLKHIRLSAAPGRRPNAFERWQERFANGFERKVSEYYLPLLRITTTHRYTTLAVFIGTFAVILALLLSGWTRFTFMPKIPAETASASLTMPVGVPFAITQQHVNKIADAATTLQEKYRDPITGESTIINILSVTGASGGRSSNASNVGRVQFEVTPAEERDNTVSTGQLAEEWRRLVGSIPGAESLNFRSSIFRAGDPINIQLSGNSLATLSEVGEKVKAKLATYAGVYEIADSLSDGKEELRIELKPQGHLWGLTRSDVATQVGQAFKGVEAQRIQRGRDDIRVLVRLPNAERSTIETLDELLITAPDGSRIPLIHVADLKPGKGPAQITRIDGYRVLNVTAEIEKDKTNMTVLQSDLRAYIDDLLLQYPSIQYTMEGEAKEQRESFGSLQSGIIGVLFVIYCLLALPLRSYSQPLIVMSIIPFGMIGAVAGHWMLGYDLSMLSIFGLMALIGVLVNDSLVLVDYINKRTTEGVSLDEAVLKAGVARFRPVFLTSLTTFFGLLPLISEKSTSAQFLIPMAISLGFGILFATLITLLMVPSNVLIADDLRKALTRLLGREISSDGTGDRPRATHG